MDKALLSGYITLWKSGTPEYRWMLLMRFDRNEVSQFLKALKVEGPLDLIDRVRTGEAG